MFSSPKWVGDHEIINVTNNGDRPLIVKAWIDSPSNNLTIPVEPGATKTISTTSILTQDNQILNIGFDAYENGTSIDSYKATIAVGPTPTPATSATMTRAPGFTILIALACIMGIAYIKSRKKER